MVAQGNAVDAGVHQFMVDFRRDARARRGVLGVGHHQIEILLAAQSAHRLFADVPPGLADDVADEEDSHGKDIAVRGRGNKAAALSGLFRPEVFLRRSMTT